MIPIVELSPKAFVDQKKELLEKLEKQSQVLQKDIRELEVKKKNLKEVIYNACMERQNDLISRLKKVKEAERVKTESITEYNQLIASAKKAIADFEGVKKEEYRKIETQKKNNEIAKKTNNETRVKNDDIASTIRAKEVEADKRLEEAKSIEKGNLVQTKIATDALNKLEQEKANNEIILRRVKTTNEESDKKLKEITEGFEKNISYASVLQKKEKELIAKSEGQDKRDADFNKDKERQKDKKEDIIIIGRKNQSEEARLKAWEKDLINRDAKLRDREKLFKTKIGG